MSGIPRRTLTELTARYELHPELADVYVEGPFDQDLVESLFRATAQMDRVAYPVDSVEITGEVLVSHGLDEGAKQRVIALAHELSELPPSSRFRCLVDSDLDRLFGTLAIVPRLVWTDYCSVECYFLSSKFAHSVLVDFGKISVGVWDDLYFSLVAVLKQLYAFRAADKEMSLKLGWINPDACLSKTGDKIAFDTEDYARRILLKNGKAAMKGQLAERAQDWFEKLGNDPRTCARGHDFVHLLAWVIRHFRGLRSVASEEAIERLLIVESSHATPILDLLA